MIVKHLTDEIENISNGPSEQWVSRRLLLKDDGMGFSLHYTTVKENCTLKLWYKYHLEAVYFISGEGELKNMKTGEVHQIKAGSLYALNKHEKHHLYSKTEMHAICVFYPPITGMEIPTTEEGYFTITKE